MMDFDKLYDDYLNDQQNIWYQGSRNQKILSALKAAYNAGVEDTKLNGGYNLKDIWDAHNRGLEDAARIAEEVNLAVHPSCGISIARAIRGLKSTDEKREK